MRKNPLKSVAVFLARRAGNADLILLTLLVALVAVASYRQTLRVGQSRQGVVHSYEVRNQIQAVYTEVREVEAAQRGYLLTGNPVFLGPEDSTAPFQANGDGRVGLIDVGPLLQELRTLKQITSDNPRQQSNVDLLSSLVRDRLEYADSTIRLYREKGMLAAGAEINSGQGSRMMAQIRDVVSGMLTEEDVLFKKRQDAEKRYWTRNKILIGGGIFTAYLGLLFMMWLGRRQKKRRRSAETEMLRHAMLLKAVMDGGKHGIVMTNRERNVIVFNRAGERMYGYDAGYFIGKNVSYYVDKIYVRSELEEEAERLSVEAGRRVSVEELFLFAIQTYGTYEREWTANRRDGVRIPILLTVTAMLDQGGKFYGSIGIFQDISERKELDQAKNDFISMASHELRTPITSIRGALGLVVGEVLGPLPEKVMELLSIAHKNCERLVLIINDILDIGKIESGKLPIHFQSNGVYELVIQALEANKGYGEKYGVHFVLKEIPPQAQVVADPDRFMQIMANLLSNAAKFSPQGAEVWVSADRHDARVYFSVRDFGAGIPAAFRKNVFEKFAQADSSNTRYNEGTGLGLSIARKLVEAMQGSIHFETEMGKGTTFFFDLPCATGMRGFDV